MNEEGAVVAWELTNSTSQDEIKPVLNEVKFKLKNNQISYIYTDTCLLRFQKGLRAMFPRSSNQVRSFSCNLKNYQNLII